MLRAWLDASGGRLLVRVDARGARYPLRIDPFVQQGAKLVGTGAVGAARQGYSVALSADGNTALVGGLYDNGGASGRRGCSRARGRPGPSRARSSSARRGVDPEQGWSVALSSDGNTALVGGPGDDAAWVFTRSGTTWTQQGSKLVGTARPARRPGLQRGAVGRREHRARRRHRRQRLRRGDVGVHALGDDLDPAGVEARRHRRGRRLRPRARAWRCRPTGTRRSSAATATTAARGGVGVHALGDDLDPAGLKARRHRRGRRRQQGASVALSDDGNTALVGGTATDAGGGGVGVHALGDELDPAGVKARRHRRGRRRRPRWSVALSGDGNTALVGGARRQRRRGGGVGVHALGDDLDPAGLEARRHRRGRHRQTRARAWRCRATGTPRSSAASATTAPARGRRGCSRARGRRGPSRAQSSSAPATAASPARATSVALSGDGNTALVGGAERQRRRGGGVGVRRCASADERADQGEPCE